MCCQSKEALKKTAWALNSLYKVSLQIAWVHGDPRSSGRDSQLCHPSREGLTQCLNRSMPGSAQDSSANAATVIPESIVHIPGMRLTMEACSLLGDFHCSVIIICKNVSSNMQLLLTKGHKPKNLTRYRDRNPHILSIMRILQKKMVVYWTFFCYHPHLVSYSLLFCYDAILTSDYISNFFFYYILLYYGTRYIPADVINSQSVLRHFVELLISVCISTHKVS